MTTLRQKLQGFGSTALFISAIVGLAASYGFITSTMYKYGVLNVPLIGSSGKTHGAQTKSAATTSRLHDPSKPLIIDFSTMPDGPLSPRVWNFERGSTAASYNNEAQTYTSRKENARIENGTLIIEGRREDINGRKYSSARINTKDYFEFTYGSLEVEAMLPRGRGTWPAAWLMPASNKYNPDSFGIAKDDKWRWAMNGEIDFLEAIGSRPGENLPAAHSYNEFQRPPTLNPIIMTRPYDKYYRYGIIKTPTEITFTLNGRAFDTRKKTTSDPREWPFDQPYYLILNVALGGSWGGVDGIDDASAPWQMKIKTISYKPL